MPISRLFCTGNLLNLESVVALSVYQILFAKCAKLLNNKHLNINFRKISNYLSSTYCKYTCLYIGVWSCFRLHNCVIHLRQITNV